LAAGFFFGAPGRAHILCRSAETRLKSGTRLSIVWGLRPNPVEAAVMLLGHPFRLGVGFAWREVARVGESLGKPVASERACERVLDG